MIISEDLGPDLHPQYFHVVTKYEVYDRATAEIVEHLLNHIEALLTVCMELECEAPLQAQFLAHYGLDFMYPADTARLQSRLKAESAALVEALATIASGDMSPADRRIVYEQVRQRIPLLETRVAQPPHPRPEGV